MKIISLLDTKSKILFGILSQPLTKYLIDNKYIEKGKIPGIPGCIELTVVTQLLREVKEDTS